MPVQCKAQYFYELFGRDGFSETYWGSFADMPTAKTACAALGVLRLATLTDDAKCVYAKIHNLATKRVVAVPTGIVDELGTYVPTVTPAVRHSGDECLLLRLEAATFETNHKFLHGLGNWTNDGEKYLPETGFTTAMDAFIAALVASWQVRTKDQITQLPVYKAIASGEIERVTNHKVGRPFGGPRGARMIRV